MTKHDETRSAGHVFSSFKPQKNENSSMLSKDKAFLQELVHQIAWGLAVIVFAP